MWDIISSDDINHFNGDSSYIANSSLVGGYTYPSEKYDFVNWDDEIPNIWKNKIHVPKHQPDFNGYGGGISTMMYNATSMNHLWDEYLWDIISSDDINHFNGGYSILFILQVLES